MPSSTIRSTRRLRFWMEEQVKGGNYPGLIWDDNSNTRFRIPWKHAGKQDFRSDDDAAIFKAWAEFKGKLSEGGHKDPASWKTRLRCALNKSPDFKEVPERSQLDISEPYKVYQLVPFHEQGVAVPQRKCKEETQKTRKRKSSSESGSEQNFQPKQMKEEEVTTELHVEDIILGSELRQESPQQIISLQGDGGVINEIQLDVRIETGPPPPGVQDSFHVEVSYLGFEVLKREVPGSDMRITYLPASPLPPTPASLMWGFPRITLPEPPSTLTANAEHRPQLQALSTLLPFMEKGVALISNTKGVFARRFCRGRVFWVGPHTDTPGLHKIDRYADPELLFSREAFSEKLDHFRANGGEPPQCGVTLCFGEELSGTEDPSNKLIIVKITFPWAKQQVEDAQTIMNSMSFLHTLASQSPLGEITLNLVPVPAALTVEILRKPASGGNN